MIERTNTNHPALKLVICADSILISQCVAAVVWQLIQTGNIFACHSTPALPTPLRKHHLGASRAADRPRNTHLRPSWSEALK